MNSINFVSAPIISTHYSPKLVSFTKAKTKPYSLNCSIRLPKLRVSALKDQHPDSKSHSQTRNVADEKGKNLQLDENGDPGFDIGWLPAFPHVLVASMSNFTFGYHIGLVTLSLSLHVFQ